MKSLLFALLLAVSARASDQLIVSIAPGWNSMAGKLQLFERSGGEWKAESGVIPALYGKNGLAWGRGIHGTDEPGLKKVEGDWRAPAGVFDIGKIYSYDAKLPAGSDYPFHQVTDADAWADDIHSPDYNRLVTIPDPKDRPPWFEKAKMRQKDFAYRWLIDIKHNADPPVPGAGSAIFFHIRRGVTRPTSGCTTMAENNLVEMIRWLRADKHPHYVLLPWSEYQKKWREWDLPDPAAVRAITP